MQTSTINMELESTSSYVEELKTTFLMDGTDYQRKSIALQDLCQELSNIFYEIECSLQLPFSKGGTNQVCGLCFDLFIVIIKYMCLCVHVSNYIIPFV